MSRSSLVLASAAVALLVSAGAATAQACLGLPTRDGQIAVAGAYGVNDAYNTVGGQFNIDVTGPASFGFGYSRDVGADELEGGGDFSAHLFEARAAYEMYLLEPSICAVAGVWYNDVTGVDQIGVPVGFGFGKTLRGQSFSTTLYAIPQYVWLRTSFDDTQLPDEDSNEFMGEAGLTLGFLRFYVGGGVVVTTIDDQDPRLTFRAGLFF
jgi:hypothetical protein